MALILPAALTEMGRGGGEAKGEKRPGESLIKKEVSLLRKKGTIAMNASLQTFVEFPKGGATGVGVGVKKDSGEKDLPL